MPCPLLATVHRTWWGRRFFIAQATATLDPSFISLIKMRTKPQSAASRMTKSCPGESAFSNASSLSSVGTTSPRWYRAWAFRDEGPTQNLDRDRAIEARVGGAIHLAHTARAERRADAGGSEAAA